MKKFIYQGKVYNKSILKCYWRDNNALYFILESKEFKIPLASAQLIAVWNIFDEKVGRDEDINLDELIKIK